MSNQYFDRADSDDHRSIGILMAVFPILFFIPFVAENLKGSVYLRFRANQSCIVFLFGAADGILCRVIGIVPLIGWVIAEIVGWLLGIIALILIIINIVNAVTEQTQGKPLPVIGFIEIIK